PSLAVNLESCPVGARHGHTLSPRASGWSNSIQLLRIPRLTKQKPKSVFFLHPPTGQSTPWETLGLARRGLRRTHPGGPPGEFAPLTASARGARLGRTRSPESCGQAGSLSFFGEREKWRRNCAGGTTHGHDSRIPAHLRLESP